METPKQAKRNVESKAFTTASKRKLNVTLRRSRPWVPLTQAIVKVLTLMSP